MITSTKHLLTKRMAVAAFNFGTLDIAQSILAGATSLAEPFIFELNAKEADFIGIGTAFVIAESFSKNSLVDFSLHLDHCSDVDTVLKAAAAGFTSGLIDISEMQVETGFRLVAKLKEKLPKDFLLEVTVSSPSQALHLDELGANLLAVEKDNFCDLSLLKSVRRITNLPLVMHGGSSRSMNEIQEAIRLGVVKINMNTCLRKAWREGLESTFKENSDMLQSYELLKKSKELVKQVVIEKIRYVCP
ncbi:MAG: class II fructose-bisphosphate aldolase [candidate division WWE3 bacterium]|nr:class II fructose-bisphosphate aldolase [candidate division WWE3 bacterium]